MTFPYSDGHPLRFRTAQITAIPISRIKLKQKVKSVHFSKETHSKTRSQAQAFLLLAAFCGPWDVLQAALHCVPKHLYSVLSFQTTVWKDFWINTFCQETNVQYQQYTCLERRKSSKGKRPNYLTHCPESLIWEEELRALFLSVSPAKCQSGLGNILPFYIVLLKMTKILQKFS